MLADTFLGLFFATCLVAGIQRRSEHDAPTQSARGRCSHRQCIVRSFVSCVAAHDRKVDESVARLRLAPVSV